MPQRVGTGVKTKHPKYDEYAAKWRRARDVTDGQDKIYAGGELYLSKLTGEALPEYQARQRRTPFFNASWRTVAGFVGMIFRKPPVKDIPETLDKYLKDATMTGVSFDDFAKEVVYEDLIVSFVGIYVDHPPSAVSQDGRPLTIADAEKRGLRPAMKRYDAEQIWNWDYQFQPETNRTVLSQVRLHELSIERIDEFRTEEVGLIRVLDLDESGDYRVRVFYEENEEQKGEDIYPTLNGQKMKEIPFFFVGPDGTIGEYDEPVMIDLFDLNIKHFQVSADYEHGCHMTALPTPYVTGYQTQSGPNGEPVKEDFKIGSTTAWVFPDPNAKVGFLEFQGGGLQSLEKNLDRKEAQMAAIGARMLAPEKTGVEASETLAMRHSGENSILAAVSVSCSAGLSKALTIFAQWCNVKAEVKIELNRDFMPFVIDPAKMTALLAAVQAGRISGETFFDIMQRGDVVPADRTFEEEQERIDATPLPTPVTVEQDNREQDRNDRLKREEQERQDRLKTGDPANAR